MKREPEDGNRDTRPEQPPRAAQRAQRQGVAVDRCIEGRKDRRDAALQQESGYGEEADDVDGDSDTVGEQSKPENDDNNDRNNGRDRGQGWRHSITLSLLCASRPSDAGLTHTRPELG